MRGLRAIEQAVLQRRKTLAEEERTLVFPEPADTAPADTAPAAAVEPASAGVDAEGSVGLDSCATVRGIRDDDQGGPLEPPGLRTQGDCAILGNPR